MISKALWYAALAALAALTAVLQLDRQSARTPVFAHSVPEPFRSFAQAQIAAASLTSGAATEAVAEAERLVRRRPVPAENLRLLAQAQLAAGQDDRALRTIQFAARRGWRDPFAQETMLRIAVAAGDDVEAARRYTALFLQNRTQDALLEEFGERLFAEPNGPAARELVAVLSGSRRWPDTFLRRGTRVLPPDAFAQIVTQSGERGTPFDCQVLTQAAAAVSQKSPAAGEEVRTAMNLRCQHRAE